MKCEFDRELVSSYADGALTGSLAQDVEAHISGCDACRIELEFTREFGIVLRSLPKERASEDLIRRVLIGSAGKTHRTIGDKIWITFKIVCAITIHGFRIHDDQEEIWQGELPKWVMRWLLFV